MVNNTGRPNVKPNTLQVGGYVNDTSENKSGYDVRQYLNVKLGPGETKKVIKIRVLPISKYSSDCFVSVYTHDVKVPKDIVGPGKKPYKSFVCLRKNRGIDHDKFGEKCPYCELNSAAYAEADNERDELKKKLYRDISWNARAKEHAVIRCIERGREDEGVKFWKFSLRKDKSDPYHALLDLYNMRLEASRQRGFEDNIFDLYNGRDIIVTITEGTSAPIITDDSYPSPLSENEEQIYEWVNDPKTWMDVFPPKPYEYLQIVSQMKIPWFDKKNGVWVDKDDFDMAHGEAVLKAENEIKRAEEIARSLAESDEYVSDFMQRQSQQRSWTQSQQPQQWQQPQQQPTSF